MGVVELLARGKVWYGVHGDEPEDALGSALDALYARPSPLPPELAREELLALLLEREALAPTAVGHGLALPHPRAPLLKKPDEALIALFYPRFPLPWGAADGLPVTAFFILLSSGSAEHLGALSALSKLCSAAGFRELLRREAGLDELLAWIRGVS